MNCSNAPHRSSNGRLARNPRNGRYAAETTFNRMTGGSASLNNLVKTTESWCVRAGNGVWTSLMAADSKLPKNRVNICPL